MNMRRQLTATIQDEDGHYRAARVGDTFRDPDGNLMVAVAVGERDGETQDEECQGFGVPKTIPATGSQGQVEVH